MFPSAGDELVVKVEGFLVAVVAFVLTRGVLIDVVYGGGDQSMLAAATRLFPLVLGLGVVAYGVSLAVSTRDRQYVRTVTAWYLLGSLWMLLLVGVAVVDSADPLGQLRQSAVVATAVVGGGVGGLLTGIRSANNRRQRRTLDQQADRAVLLNRLLRHEVLNALTVVRGHAGLLADGSGRLDVVRDNADRIERTVEDVGFLVRTTDETRAALGSVVLGDLLDQCRDHLPDTERVSFADSGETVRVRADEHLETVVTRLVGTALERTTDGQVTVDRSVGETTAELLVSAPGAWLGDHEQEVLSEGLPEYDSPDVDFDVSIARLLVDQYGGSIDVATDGDATTVTVELLRVGAVDTPADSPGVGARSLLYAAGAGLVAGVVMGGILQSSSGQIGVIGGLYGLQTLTIGWITHLFHSVVFAVLFAALRTRYRADIGGSITRSVATGVAYGLGLWLVAAGIVMGLWLNAVGIPSPVPNLGTVSLAGHVVWGAIVGALSHVLDEYTYSSS